MIRGIEAIDCMPYIGAKKKKQMSLFCTSNTFFEEISWPEKFCFGASRQRKNLNPPY